jgi:hypothetical protein
MALATIELNATQETVGQPILWRLGRLFNVVTNVRRARVTEDYGAVVLDIEGATQDVERATGYLRALGLLKGADTGETPTIPAPPEAALSAANTIYVRLSTVNAAQGRVPILYRLGKDFQVVVNIERAAFDEEEGGSLEITITGALSEVQRAIAYLHTTGLHVNPRQRSVTDYSNL